MYLLWLILTHAASCYHLDDSPRPWSCTNNARASKDFSQKYPTISKFQQFLLFIDLLIFLLSVMWTLSSAFSQTSSRFIYPRKYKSSLSICSTDSQSESFLKSKCHHMLLYTSHTSWRKSCARDAPNFESLWHYCQRIPKFNRFKSSTNTPIITKNYLCTRLQIIIYIFKARSFSTTSTFHVIRFCLHTYIYTNDLESTSNNCKYVITCLHCFVAKREHFRNCRSIWNHVISTLFLLLQRLFSQFSLRKKSSYSHRYVVIRQQPAK